MMLSGSATISFPRTNKHRQTSISAATVGFDSFGTLSLAAGRTFASSEASHNAPVIVVSHTLANELANGRGAETMVGQFVRVRGVPREVIGVYTEVNGEKCCSARVPFAAAASALGPSAPLRTPQILLKANSVEDIPTVRAGVEDWLATRFRGWDKSVEIRTREQQLAQTVQGFGIMKLFLGALAGISLLVGGIGIMNIMLANVTERTREIGVRKAIGARSRDIHLQFLTEAVAVSCCGSAMGVIIGALITAAMVMVMRRVYHAQSLAFVVSTSTVAFAAFAAVTIGLVFGTYPARRAGRLSPIDAIRHE
jgi:putative ABC transport system permease protein